MSSGAAASPRAPKARMSGARRLPRRSGTASSERAEPSTKKGKSEGIITSAQTPSPWRMPPAAASGQASSAASAAAAQAREEIYLYIRSPPQRIRRRAAENYSSHLYALPAV